jgi:ParB-like chromosome segregation protein Spo0J
MRKKMDLLHDIVFGEAPVDASVCEVPMYKAHPIAACWPLVEGDAFEALCSSIRTHGLLQPIVLFEDQILDGRNRYAACTREGVEPRFDSYTGDDPVGFALTINGARRQMSASQRAIVAAIISRLRRGSNQHASRDASSLALSQTEAAERLGVSRAQVQRARVVCEMAAPEVVDAVRRGQMPVSIAAMLTSAPLDQQRAVAALTGSGTSARAAVQQIVHGGIKRAACDRVGPSASKTACSVADLFHQYQALSPDDQTNLFERLEAYRGRGAHQVKAEER